MTVVLVVVVVALSASCADKKCAPCPAPGTGTGTGYTATLDAPSEEEYAGYEFRLVRQGDNVGFVGTSSKGRVVVIPLDPRTRMFSDGKEGTAGELLAFAPSTGGCPCTQQRCIPYCRVAAAVLDVPLESFWGSADVPKWPPVTPAPAPTP